jgi:transcriptional regulator with XRE-family HTH domain
LRRLRTERRLSLGQLARTSGVSRAMLGQIELGQSTPTVNTVSKIASALAVSFQVLLAEADGDGLAPAAATGVKGPGATAGRALSSADELRARTETKGTSDPRALVFYDVHLPPHASISAELGPTNGGENALVVEGQVAIVLPHERYDLVVGDVLYFESDGPYEYRNEGALPAHLYVAMSHARALCWPMG